MPETEKRAFVLYESKLEDKEGELEGPVSVCEARETVAPNTASPYNSTSRCPR